MPPWISLTVAEKSSWTFARRRRRLQLHPETGSMRQAYKQLLTELPHAARDIKKQVYAGDVLFIEWAADAATTRADGVNTFVFRDGKIHAQTIHYNLQHKN
jgi:hypothetical protein